METRLVSVSSGVILLLAVTVPLKAQTAEEIIDRYIEAIGGRQAVASIETMKYVRTVLNTQDGTTIQQSRRTIYTKRPYFYRTEDADTRRIYISDGMSAWSGRAVADSDSIIWREASFVLRSPDLDLDRLFGAFIDFARKGYRAEYAGMSEREGAQLHIVTVTWKEGHHWDFYFDSSTGLCYGFNPNPNGPEGFTRVDHYRRIGDVLVPHRNISIDTLPDADTRQHERIYSSIEFNLALDESFFLPAKR
jgi:hypothetical protein